ncbi:hypothetical protein [Occallatibacter riparius]|uniref:Uncharacterized protein n=1 Tax=Occallatibacter riparius TaxID=1002689 RepID=A0A9J7BPV7_9BACT|nr:hypothetical protein [Occallatibacter riparius]UWZ84631.1 hypothetical protein MOP44_01550 [Occallatibacter riparius]
MAKSTEPKRRFLLQTSQAVFEEGALRQVTVEAYDGFAVVRLKGLPGAFPLPWGAVYRLAEAQAAERRFKGLMAKLGIDA